MKLYYAKLNCSKNNCLTLCKQKLYLYETELFGLELFDLKEYLEIEMFLKIKLCTYAKLNCLKKNCLFV